jgi:hypothetical protein
MIYFKTCIWFENLIYCFSKKALSTDNKKQKKALSLRRKFSNNSFSSKVRNKIP